MTKLAGVFSSPALPLPISILGVLNVCFFAFALLFLIGAVEGDLLHVLYVATIYYGSSFNVL